MVIIFNLLGIFIFSLYKIFIYLNEGKIRKDTIISEIGKDKENDTNKSPIDFKKYKNREVEGYIFIEGLKISYPVLKQKDNNTYYLSHDHEKNYSSHGSIFFDYQADIENLDKLQNIFIYGHNMLDKTMFGKLISYTDKKTFNKNKTIYLFLKKINAKLTLEVFSAYLNFNNEMYEKTFADVQNKDNYIKKALSKGKVSKKPESENNTIITLYTCSPNNSRLYVHAIIKEIKYYD